MSNPSKEKGTRAETLIKNLLKEYTGLAWERTPLSGGLNIKHGIKSDLYIPNEKNIYSVEVKHYEFCHINHTLISGKNPQLIEWWIQCTKDALDTHKKPLLIFKHDRSKIYCAFNELPIEEYPFIFINKEGHELYVSLLIDFILHNKPKFI